MLNPDLSVLFLDHHTYNNNYMNVSNAYKYLDVLEKNWCQIWNNIYSATRLNQSQRDHDKYFGLKKFRISKKRHISPEKGK